jgi:uncharacterized protein (TIGR03546 family)
MILPGFISKILAAFRGGISPVLIFLSVFLGFWFGMVPGFSGFHVVLLVFMLLLNIPIGMLIFWGILGRGLCYAAAPVLFHVGTWMQGNMPFVFRFFKSLPIVGLTDFSTYSVAGGFILGPIVGIVIGLLMVRSVVSFRGMLLKLEEGSEKFRKWYSKTWVRILDRVLIGKRTKDAKSLFTKKTKYIRKAGAALAVIVIVVSLIVAGFVKDQTLKEYAARTMTRANGAEVNLDQIGISILNGAVSASGIQVTDPENPVNNQVAIDKVSADASVYDLLLGKVVMEQVEISNVQFDQRRATPGKLYEKKVKEEPKAFEPNDYKLSAADLVKLEKYFKDAKALKEKLQKLSKYLPSGEGEKEAEPEPEQLPQKYLEYLTASALVPVSPRIMAKIATLDKVQVPSEIFGNSKIQLTNVNDAPKAAGLPITFEMNSLEAPASLNVTIDYSQDTPKLTGTFDALDLSKIQSSLSSDAGLVFKSGTLSGKFSGIATNETLDLSLDINIQNLNAEGQGDGVLGLGSDATSEALAVLDNLKTTIQIVGPVTEPRLLFDVKGLTEEFKQALVKAGKERLANEVDKQLSEQIDEQLGEDVPDEVKEVLKKPDELLKKGLGDLLGGDKEKEDE